MNRKKNFKYSRFQDLKPATQTISIRFSKELLDKIKARANLIDVPYQSLIKVYLADKLAEIKRKSGTIKQ